MAVRLWHRSLRRICRDSVGTPSCQHGSLSLYNMHCNVLCCVVALVSRYVSWGFKTDPDRLVVKSSPYLKKKKWLIFTISLSQWSIVSNIDYKEFSLVFADQLHPALFVQCVGCVSLSLWSGLTPRFNVASTYNWGQQHFPRRCPDPKDGFSPVMIASCTSSPSPPKLSLYTLNWILTVEQITALKPDTVLSAQKGLTGLSWINNWDPNITLHSSWLVFVELPPAQGVVVGGL